MGLTWLALRARDGSGNALGRLVDIQVLLNNLWNWLDLRAELLFDSVEVEPIFPIDQVNSQTQMSKTTRTTDTMQVCLSVLREVEVDDNVDGLNIYTTRQEIRTNEITANTIAEIMENTVAVVLQHAGVRIEAGVSKLCDLLCQKFDAIRGIAEDDGLVDLELVEEGVQTVHLLLLFNKCVVLRDTAECEFIHQVDLVWRVHVLVLRTISKFTVQESRHITLKLLTTIGKVALNSMT